MPTIAIPRAHEIGDTVDVQMNVQPATLTPMTAPFMAFPHYWNAITARGGGTFSGLDPAGDPVGSTMGWEETMAKSREQRIKELTKPSAVRAAWGAINAKYKDFNAPIFLKIGNISDKAKDYDDATKEFLDTAKKKSEDAAKILGDVTKQWDTNSSKIDDLIKEIASARADVNAGMKFSKGDEPEDGLEEIQEAVKASETGISEVQSVVDNLMKAYQARTQAASTGEDKLQKTIDTANSTIDKANKNIDTAEQDIRKLVRGYYSTALDMNRKDMADAVNKLLAEFGR